MSVAVPALGAYFQHLPRPFVDGGFYAKTEENRPLIGPLPVAGAYITSAFSGFGIMMACAAGELLAAHVTGTDLPTYADAFKLERYQDPTYLAQFADSASTGQI
jgi:glycine/D-amino acid oxidase-like deaminating enzyme